MATDKQVKKYFENLPYGKDSKAIEIHGKKNKIVASKFIASLVRNYDEALMNNDKEKASYFYDAIIRIDKEYENLKAIKEEFAMNYGGGVGGKNQFSNYTDLSFDRKLFTEQCDIVFDKNMNLVCVVQGDDGKEIVKQIPDITENWVLKGAGENTYMKMQQDCIRQQNTQGKPLDFDIDYAVSNLLADNDAWKSFVSDKIGGRYFLQDYVIENADNIQNGNIPDEMLHPDSFNPEQDGRLHAYFANRLRKSFNPNYQTQEEIARTDNLMNRLNTKDNQNSQA